MDQIYYTQSPIGYGLGASNGFQVKRITAGYPVSGDFRHLGLRAFSPGSRTLAPPALRYRKVGDLAEVAWLTPRVQEYETERGLWGRPGGHFAHGLIFTLDDLAAIDAWPAGLHHAAVWRRADAAPTRGRPPEPITITVDDLFARPEFPSVVPLAADLDADRLARLLAAVAAVAREGRTLFLIDEPERLGPRIALLTFLFPSPLRAALTFSTYHDRPEELPGYRLHGTTLGARPNRGLLLAHGIVADLSTGTIDPTVETPDWARTIAGWVVEGRSRSWEGFRHRVLAAQGSASSNPWDDGWLDCAVGFEHASRLAPGEASWPEEAVMAAWANRSNASDDWAKARGPAWWSSAEVGDGEGRETLLAVAGWPASWGIGRAEEWGQVFGQWFSTSTPAVREDAAVVLAKAAPTDLDRYALARSIRRSLPRAHWEPIRARLTLEFRANPTLAALWAVPDAVAAALDRQPERLRRLADQVARVVGGTVELLGAVALEAEGQTDRIALLGAILVDLFAEPAALRWAFEQTRDGDGGTHEASAWVGPYLRHTLATPEALSQILESLRDMPESVRPVAARTLLIVASNPELPEETFTRSIEEVLLPIPPDVRPRDSHWAGLYLERSPSDLALIDKLFLPKTRSDALLDWFKAAIQDEELSVSHRDRLMNLKRLARALSDRYRGTLDGVDLTRIPAGDRGALLALLLKRDALASFDPSPTLERCGASWPESLLPSADSLVAIARAIVASDFLATFEDVPPEWRRRMIEIACRLLRTSEDQSLHRPDGLVARMVAARNQARGPTVATWNLRLALMRDEAAWRTLAEDLRLDLDAHRPADAPGIVECWDSKLSKSPGRFWELVLNVCDNRRLSAVVSAFGADLATLEPLPWWDHARHHDARDDLRDAFGRLAPMAPLLEESLAAVQRWMESPLGFATVQKGSRPWLSPLGAARWTCIDRLTKDVYRRGSTDQARCHGIRDWVNVLPLDEISLDDRYRLLARVIYKLEDPSALDYPRIGLWLVRSGLDDPARLKNWSAEIDGLVDEGSSAVQDRGELVRELRREMGQVIADRRG